MSGKFNYVKMQTRFRSTWDRYCLFYDTGFRERPEAYELFKDLNIQWDRNVGIRRDSAKDNFDK